MINRTDGPATTTARWSAVGAVAATVFAVVTTEMLPVGLSTAIGADLHTSDGTVGLTMTVPGLVAAVCAPLVPRVAGTLDRRTVLLVFGGMLTLVNLASAAVPNIAWLVALRVLVGVCIGGIWAIAGGLAGRLVPERSVGPATSVVFSGVAVASVVGIPAGAVIGGATGWRVAFVTMAAVSLLLTALLAGTLPPLPPAGPPPSVRRLVAVPGVRVGLLAVLFIVTGHFAAYTYVRPLLERLGGIAPDRVGVLLVAYGVAGVIGTAVAGLAAARAPRPTLGAVAATLGLVVLVAPLLVGSLLGAALALVAWGFAYGGVSVTTQNWLRAAAPGAGEAATALFVCAFNVAIAVGALLGGRVVDAASLTAVMVIGAVLAMGGFVVATLGRP